MRRMHRACCLLLSLAVSACSASETTMNTDNPASPAPDAQQAALESRYKRNPNPKQAYQITVTLADAPGPFESVEGFAQYFAPDCSYIVDKLAGATANPKQNLPLRYKKIDATTYVGTVYLDAMQDGDYHGNGICHWEFVQASVELRATGAPGETYFLTSIANEILLADKTMTSYYWKERYPRSETDSFPDLGESDPTEFKPELQEALFTITLTPSRAEP